MNQRPRKRLPFGATCLAIAMCLVVLKMAPKKNGVSDSTRFLEVFKREKWNQTVSSPNKGFPAQAQNKINSTADLQQEDSTAKSKQEDLCWEQINKDIGVSDFISHNRSEFDRVLGMWLLTGDELDPHYVPLTDVAKFYYALGLSDLLSGRKIPLDLPRAYALMNEVIESNPFNSAPILFGIIISRKLGSSENQLLEKVKSTTYFDAFASDLSRTIYSRVRSSADFLQAIGLWSQTPIADYTPLKELLLQIGSKDLGKQLVDKGLNHNVPLNDLDWFGVEYVVGTKALKVLDPKLKLPSYSEVVFKKNSMHDLNSGKMLEDMRTSCNLTAVDPYVKMLQAYLNK